MRCISPPAPVVVDDGKRNVSDAARPGQQSRRSCLKADIILPRNRGEHERRALAKWAFYVVSSVCVVSLRTRRMNVTPRRPTVAETEERVGPLFAPPPSPPSHARRNGGQLSPIPPQQNWGGVVKQRGGKKNSLLPSLTCTRGAPLWTENVDEFPEEAQICKADRSAGGEGHGVVDVASCRIHAEGAWRDEGTVGVISCNICVAAAAVDAAESARGGREAPSAREGSDWLDGDAGRGATHWAARRRRRSTLSRTPA